MDKFNREPILNVNSLDNRVQYQSLKMFLFQNMARILSLFYQLSLEIRMFKQTFDFSNYGQPTNGQARVTNRNKLIYTPNRAFTGTDTLITL